MLMGCALVELGSNGWGRGVYRLCGLWCVVGHGGWCWWSVWVGCRRMGVVQSRAGKRVACNILRNWIQTTDRGWCCEES